LKKDIRYINTDTAEKSSTGLGLNLCHSIIHKNDGDIEIESKEGKGTTIKLKLKKHGAN
jgi:signal transduction histidine kinase